MSDLIPAQSFDLSPKSLEEALTFADYLSKSSIVPKDFQDKPGNILVAIQWGMELGLKPMQAMQNIAVINGRPSLWGDAVLALVRASPLCEYVYESIENGTATCRVKRRGEEEQVRTFSDADAKQAGLIGKQGPWAQYPQRMKQMRARAFALRDVFPDVLKGMPIAEEIADHAPIEKDITPRGKQSPTQIAQAAQQSAQITRTEKHKSMIADLELIAKEGGPEPLAAAWGRMTKEDRKAIGPDELNRLKSLAGAEDVATNDGGGDE